MRYLAWLSAKVYGPPPAKGASELERLGFVQRFCVRSLVFYVPLFLVVALFGAPTILLIIVSACLVVGVINIASVTRKIRRAKRARHRLL